jgi:hypothetical protein
MLEVRVQTRRHGGQYERRDLVGSRPHSLTDGIEGNDAQAASALVGTQAGALPSVHATLILAQHGVSQRLAHQATHMRVPFRCVADSIQHFMIKPAKVAVIELPACNPCSILSGPTSPWHASILSLTKLLYF